MKKILAITAALIALICSSSAFAQEVSTQVAEPKDTVSIPLLENVEPGDILPFKYIFQRARIKVDGDTVITLSITKDILLEVVKNDREEETVLFNITQSDFQKYGPESNNPFKRHSLFAAEGLPVQIEVRYNGKLYSPDVTTSIDSLVARTAKAIEFAADTLSQSSFNKDNFSKEEILQGLAFKADTSYVLGQFVDKLSNIFYPGAYKWVPDEVYNEVDSTISEIDGKWHYRYSIDVLDQQFSNDNPEYANIYVIRKMERFDEFLFLNLFGKYYSEKEALDLIEKYGNSRFVRVLESSILVEKTSGIPIMSQTQMVDGFYDDIGDDFILVENTVIAFDVEKFMSLQEEKDEEEDEGEIRYDDYGFIKVK